MKELLPPTSERVEENTNPKVNAYIEAKIQNTLIQYQNADAEKINRRLRELDREWDTERVLETSAASFVLLGIVLGYFVNAGWFLFSGGIAIFLLQHALQGWCPPLPVIRYLGVRTAKEINEERINLKWLRGDFASSPIGESSHGVFH